MANSLPITAAQSGPILFAHRSHRFLSHGLHMVLPGRSAPFVEYLSEADAGRSRRVQSLVFLRQISSVFAPIPRPTVEPTYAYGTEYQLRAYATWLLA